MSSIARIASVALITAGLVVLADVAVTLAWKEPVSSIYGSIQQGRAADEVDELEASFPAVATAKKANLGRQAKRLARRFERKIETGKGIGTIRIESIGAEYTIVEGTDTTTLQKGPGRYPETALPGQGRTIGIAGHRTTYLAPFRKIDKIDSGDRLVVEMPYGTFTYRVERSRIVEPHQVEIVRDVGYERIVLTACHPLYSAAQRYAIFGRLESISAGGVPPSRRPAA